MYTTYVPRNTYRIAGNRHYATSFSRDSVGGLTSGHHRGGTMPRNLLILRTATMNSTWREHLEYLFAGANPNSTRAAVEYKATIVPERCVSLERRRENDIEGGKGEREK